MAITEIQKKRTHERAKRAFGQVLKKIRTEKGMTQEKLGDESDCHSTYISQLERGVKQPSLATFFILSKCLDIKPDVMIKAVSKKMIPQKRVKLKNKSRQ